MTFLGGIIELCLQWVNFLEKLIAFLNKETKNKASVLKMQLIAEHGLFVVKIYCKISIYLEVKKAFGIRFPEKEPPIDRTKWKNLKNFERERTSLTMNKGRSGRKRTVKTEEIIEVFRSCVENNARNFSLRHNGLGLSCSTFNKIMKLDLTP